ncbi:hypothetical protein J32TS6_15970 [Virgibacillus pantothenticus]|nr:hypothetical protein J32TS6_15970 [Virgibacillus pantothenticus]
MSLTGIFSIILNNKRTDVSRHLNYWKKLHNEYKDMLVFSLRYQFDSSTSPPVCN